MTDKTGIVDFARRLTELGVELISTGGTAKIVRDAGIPVKDVSEVTGFPEMLDGRVKTMHPLITGGILAIRENPQHVRALEQHGIQPIDMVVVNLYQFEKVAAKTGVTVEELIENIDIGGPTMIRSAAKNFHDVAVVVSPDDYRPIYEEMRDSRRHAVGRNPMAPVAKSIPHHSRLRCSHQRPSGTSERVRKHCPAVSISRADKLMDLRYGENPHQQAALYGSHISGVAGAEQLHGKELSYNNLVDLDAAWQLVNEFTQPATAIIKHTNPSGCAEQETLAESYRKALECDPVSAFGGVVGFNRRWIWRQRRTSPSSSSKPLRRRIIPRRRWRFCRRRKIFGS